MVHEQSKGRQRTVLALIAPVLLKEYWFQCCSLLLPGRSWILTVSKVVAGDVKAFRGFWIQIAEYYPELKAVWIEKIQWKLSENTYTVRYLFFCLKFFKQFVDNKEKSRILYAGTTLLEKIIFWCICESICCQYCFVEKKNSIRKLN